MGKLFQHIHIMNVYKRYHMKEHHISPCSGAYGMGESDEDIIDMAFALKK